MGRTGDGAGCTKVLDNWKKFNTSGDKAVPGGWGLELQTKVREDITIMEKVPTRAFSWLKAPTLFEALVSSGDISQGHI